MNTELKTFTKTKADRLGSEGLYPDETVLGIFAGYADNRNYTQIIFELGKQYLEVCLAFHESRQEYEICAEIIRQKDKYNNSRNDNIVLKIW